MPERDFRLSVDVLERPKREFRGCHGLDAVVDAMRSNYGL